MRKKLAVVLRSYTCRPWTLAGVLLYFVVAAISVLAILSSNGPYTTTSIFDSRYDRIATLNHPAELPSWEADPSNQVSTKAISIGQRRFKKTPVANATSFETQIGDQQKSNFHEMDTTSLACLKRLVSLRGLELNAIKMTPELWQTLASLKELSYLRINAEGNVDLKELPILPKLELLSLGSVDPAELSLLRKQPSLRSVELADSDFDALTDSDDPLTTGATLHDVIQLRELIINPRMQLSNKAEDGLRSIGKSEAMEHLPISMLLCNEIQQLPNLSLISIGERGANRLSKARDEGLKQAIAASEKSITVNSRATGSISGLAYLDLMLSILLLVIVCTQIQYHFSNSVSLLLPNFTVPHLLFPMFFILGHVAMFSMLRMQAHGAHLIPSIVASSAVICFFGLLSIMPTGRFVTPVLTIVLNPVLIFLMPNILEFFGKPFWRFFQIGENPILAFAILMIELGLLAMTLVHIANRPKALAIADRIEETIGIQPVAERGKQTSARNSQCKKEPLHGSFTSLSSDSKRASVQLWNAGFERSSLGKFNWIAMVPVVVYVAFFYSNEFQSISKLGGLTVYIPTGLLIVGIYAVLIKTLVYVDRTLARKPFFEQETVLPLTKSMMRKIRMGGLWVHKWRWLVVSLCCACVATLIRFILPVWLPLSIASIWIFYFHSLFSVVGIHGLGLLLLTIQLKADKRILAYPMVATWAIGSYVIVQQRLQYNLPGVYGLELLAVLCLAVIGVMLLSIAWTRFPNVEWGDGSEL